MKLGIEEVNILSQSAKMAMGTGVAILLIGIVLLIFRISALIETHIKCVESKGETCQYEWDGGDTVLIIIIGE